MPSRSSEPGSERSDGSRRPERPSGNRTSTDTEALRLREKGLSYAAVARSLGLKRASDARSAFERALRASSGEDHAGIVAREHQRLDAIEVRIRDRDGEEPEKMERRLAALTRLREGLG
jgi:hypothetical protein